MDIRFDLALLHPRIRGWRSRLSASRSCVIPDLIPGLPKPVLKSKSPSSLQAKPSKIDFNITGL